MENAYGRTFYEAEALRGGWTVRQLNRQIGSIFYERTAAPSEQVGEALRSASGCNLAANGWWR